MSAAHAYELPPDDTAPAGAVREATHGDVVYLTRAGEPVAAVVPLDVAAAGAAAVTALEDAADIRAARAAQAEGGTPSQRRSCGRSWICEPASAVRAGLSARGRPRNPQA